MFYRSIRFKITVVYMAILALTLSVFSVLLYHYVSTSLYADVDSLLRSKADGIVHAIGAYWTTEKVGPRRYGMATEEAGVQEVAFATIAKRWVKERSKDPKLLDIIVTIFGADGSTVASSKYTQGIADISDAEFVAVRDERRSLFATLAPSFPTKKPTQWRVFVTPALQDNRVEYIVQVATPLAGVETTLLTLKVTLFILFPVTVLLTGVMGALLAKLTLRPVDVMIRSIHGITAATMKMQLAVPGTKDEIQKLAETFNDMLGRLERTFTSQKEFFQDLSHELKTPLTILRGEFEVALKKPRTVAEYEALLRSSLEEVSRIARLVENLLTLARFEAQEIAPERSDIDLGLLLQAVVNSMRTAAAAKGVTLDLAGQPSSIIVRGDEEELKQLFLNLIDNAVKYTHAGGAVAVAAAITRDRACVTVADTGIGIAEHDRARIFERFYRSDAREGTGFGLGLSIVKSIVDAHKGAITLESTVGKGTVFSVSLPLAPHP